MAASRVIVSPRSRELQSSQPSHFITDREKPRRTRGVSEYPLCAQRIMTRFRAAWCILPEKFTHSLRSPVARARYSAGFWRGLVTQCDCTRTWPLLSSIPTPDRTKCTPPLQIKQRTANRLLSETAICMRHRFLVFLLRMYPPSHSASTLV